MVFNPTLHNGPIRPKLIRAGMFHLLPAAAELVLIITTLPDLTAAAGAGSLDLFVRSVLLTAVVVVVLAFSTVIMLAVLLPLAAPPSEAVSPTVASRLERAAAVGSITTHLLATALFASVALTGDLAYFSLDYHRHVICEPNQLISDKVQAYPLYSRRQLPTCH